MENDGPTPQETNKEQEYTVDSSGTGNEVQAQLINIKALINLKYCHCSISSLFMLHQGKCGGNNL